MRVAAWGIAALFLVGAVGLPVLVAGSRSGSCGPASAAGASVKGQKVPAGIATDAAQAAQLSGVDVKVILAIAWGETTWGASRAGVSDPEVRAWLGDLAGDVQFSALQAGGATAVEVGRTDAVALGDWTNRQAAGGGEHAIGFMQFIPSTWKAQAGRHARPGGGHWDPYRPLDAMTLAGYYLAEILAGNGHDVGKAFDSYGTGDRGRAALAELEKTATAAAGAGAACAAAPAAGPGGTIPVGAVTPGNPLACQPQITQGYGNTSYEHPHHGIDYSCPEGTAEISLVEGQVVQSSGGCPAHGYWQNNCGGGYGNHVVIALQTDIGAGPHKYFVLYAHQEVTPVLAVGAQIKVGQVLGQEGSSGWSSGPHLHFEVDEDVLATGHSINPSPFVSPELRVATS